MQRKKWQGGYITELGVYVIERRILGHKWHVSTRCTTREAAMVHLRRFQANPGAYNPAGDVLPDKVVLDEAMIEAHFAWVQQSVSWETAKSYRLYLAQWANYLRGRDLRGLRAVQDLKPHLDGKRAVPHRIKALKSLYTWLVTEIGSVAESQNPTGALKVKKGTPTQFKRQVWVEWERFTKVLSHLNTEMRDVFTVLAGTGMHLTELQRFAKEGHLRARRDTDPPTIVGVLAVAQHKSGQMHVVNLVRHEHLEAAMRVKHRGHVPGRWWVLENLNRAVEALNATLPQNEQIERFTPRQLRHSVATWLRQAGVAMPDVAAFLGHLDERTTRRHYVDQFEGAVTLEPRHLRAVPG